MGKENLMGTEDVQIFSFYKESSQEVLSNIDRKEKKDLLEYYSKLEI